MSSGLFNAKGLFLTLWFREKQGWRLVSHITTIHVTDMWTLYVKFLLYIKLGTISHIITIPFPGANVPCLTRKRRNIVTGSLKRPAGVTESREDSWKQNTLFIVATVTKEVFYNYRFPFQPGQSPTDTFSEKILKYINDPSIHKSNSFF